MAFLVFDFLYNTHLAYTCPTTFISMGRSDDNIASGKTTQIAQLGGFTLPAGHSQRQNILPLLVADQLRDTSSHSRENVPPGLLPRYYSQLHSRDDFAYSGAIDGSSAYRFAEVGSTAHFPSGISNRDFFVEESMQPPQDTSFQSSVIDISYTANGTVQSYEGNAIHPPLLQHATPPSSVGTSFENDRYILDFGPPPQVSSEIPDRNPVLANPVRSRPDTISRPFGGTPLYGSIAIVPIYEGDVRHVSESHATESFRSTAFYDPVYHRSDHSYHGMTPLHPLLQSPSSIPASRTETRHFSAHQPTHFADHTVQPVSFRSHDAQRSASPQVYHIDGCSMDKDDLTGQGTNDIITVGKCLRTDSPCGLWVKTNKGSIKRHAQKWHGVARGGDTDIVSCTWDRCNTKMQKGAVPRHTLCKHFREKFQCNGCLRYLPRDDCWKSHATKCTLSGRGYIVSYNHSTRAINVKDMSLRQAGY
ncbi:uncharacterized protein EDB93DRAFT_1246546 [Suillus bovinus]|uniref:uncharacterized protein n=1 Tax=Suillus bovinus TaxID=48563 RepID=UPI001B8830BF|nr:uncharacterized protein EDB93DRAFT_1246546 [Suillus bovinus]KAG2158055.1 hypothetical protein EDB93DRAFT_1246546 [Suillus bovinus]